MAQNTTTPEAPPPPSVDTPPTGSEATPAPLQALIPARRVKLCTNIDELVAVIEDEARGRLRCIGGRNGHWLAWDERVGRWIRIRPGILAPAMKTAVTTFSMANFGTVPDVSLPTIGASPHIVHGVLERLARRPNVKAVVGEWDRRDVRVGLWSGHGLNMIDGTTVKLEPADQVTLHLGADPADDGPATIDAEACSPSYITSTWRKVIEYLIPNRGLRAYLQSRLGRALAGSRSDDILWLYGPHACGKSTAAGALLNALGGYGARLPLAGRDFERWHREAGHGARVVVMEDVELVRVDRLKAIRDRTEGKLLLAFVSASRMPAGIDEGLRRRLKPIQCGPTLERPSPFLRGAFDDLDELRVIVRWLLDGSRAEAVPWKLGPAHAPPEDDRKAVGRVVAAFAATFDAGGPALESTEVWRRWKAFLGGGTNEMRATAGGVGRRLLMVRLRTEHGWTPKRGPTGARQWTPGGSA